MYVGAEAFNKVILSNIISFFNFITDAISVHSYTHCCAKRAAKQSFNFSQHTMEHPMADHL